MDPGAVGLRAWRAPGRVNLIGEHVDYAGGVVVPFACDREILMATVPHDREVIVSSVQESGEIRLAVDREDGGPAAGWGRYVSGVVKALRETGVALRGFRGVLSSSIPAGAGLSSSAALEAVVAIALLGGARPPPEVLQRAEYLAVGVPCGIMDQTAVLHGIVGHALAIDCTAGSWRAVRMPDAGVVLIDTGTRRSLDDGRYAQRRSEAEAALAGRGPSATARRRLRHITSEKERAGEFLEAMSAGHVERMGELMTATHASLRDDFEVSSSELDAVVSSAVAHDGCFGARLVGAGFAGCVVALVRAGAEGVFGRAVEEALPGVRAFAVTAVDGAGEIPVAG